MRSCAPWWALVLACLTPISGAGQDTSTPDTVLVGVLSDWPPVYTATDEGRPTGFGVQVMDEVARRAGLEVRYRTFESFPAALDALAADEVDVIPNVGVLSSRRQGLGLGFTSPYEIQSIRVFARTASSDLRQVDDLAGRRVGVVEANVGVELAEEVPSAEAVALPDVRTAIFRLLSGEVDGLIYPEPVVRHLARAAHVDDQIRSLGPPLREVRRGMAVSPSRREELLPLLEEALVAFRETPAFQELYSRWHQPPAPFFTRDRLLALFGVVLLLVLLGMGLWRYRSVVKLNQRLQEQEARFRSLAEGLAEGIVITDLEEERIAYVNRRCCEMLGYERSELEGMAPEELIATPRDRDAVSARLVDRSRGVDESYEAELFRKDGSRLWVHVHASPYVLEGEVSGSLAALTDITARKDAEKELAEQRQRKAQKQRLAAVGRLAGGVAHDFNNLLTGILGIASLVLDDLDGDHEARKDLEEIIHFSERAASLTRQLLTFSREGPSEVEVFDPAEVVRRTESLLRRTIGEDVRLTTRVSGDVGKLRMDRSQLEQILMNLAVNARDAMPRGGELILALERVSGPNDATGTGAPAGDWIQLRVRDTGVGMDAETQTRIFEPFFTTKDAGEGTGLGLSTVYGVVTQVGGEIQVESQEGQGTEFRVTLPRHEPVARSPAPQDSPESS